MGARVSLSQKRFVADPVRRSAPAVVRSRLEPLLPLYGIVRVADLTGLDTIGVPVYSAVRPTAATLSVSAGKGLDRDAAWVSAVMESIEVAVAEAWGASDPDRGDLVRDRSARDLDLPYDVTTLNMHPLSLVTRDSRLDWLRAEDLTTGERVHVPAAAIGLRGRTARGWAPPSFVTTSNGLAAGSTRTEAVLHGLLEVVERGALARAQMPTAVRTAGLEGVLGVVTDRMRSAGCTVVLESLASTRGTTTMVCYLTQPEMPHVFGGSGCHVDPETAALRAVLEAVQSRLSVISGLRDDIPAHTYAELASGPSDLADRFRRTRSADIPLPTPDDRSTDDVLGDLVENLRAESAGPILLVDLASPGAYPAVVQVVVPGVSGAPELPGPQRGSRAN